MSEYISIYLDESGDLGFEFCNKNPSKYFVITILISKNFDVVKRAIRRTLDNKINHKKKKRLVSELKGASTTLEIKKYFYKNMQDCNNWFLHTIILDKKHLIKNSQLVIDKEELYRLLAKIVLEEIESINHTTLIQLYIDRSKNAQEISMFDSYIRSNLLPGLTKNTTLNIEHLSSEQNAGLQAVDMFCYGIARKYELDDSSWYCLFKDRIKREIIYRP